jgi:hypothetical protein
VYLLTWPWPVISGAVSEENTSLVSGSPKTYRCSCSFAEMSVTRLGLGADRSPDVPSGSALLGTVASLEKAEMSFEAETRNEAIFFTWWEASPPAQGVG